MHKISGHAWAERGKNNHAVKKRCRKKATVGPLYVDETTGPIWPSVRLCPPRNLSTNMHVGLACIDSLIPHGSQQLRAKTIYQYLIGNLSSVWQLYGYARGIFGRSTFICSCYYKKGGKCYHASSVFLIFSFTQRPPPHPCERAVFQRDTPRVLHREGKQVRAENKKILKYFFCTDLSRLRNLFRGVACRLLPVEAREYFELSPGIFLFERNENYMWEVESYDFHFSVSGLPTAIPDQSRCDLKLKKKLDYETKSSFVMQILAEVTCSIFLAFQGIIISCGKLSCAIERLDERGRGYQERGRPRVHRGGNNQAK